MQFSALFSFMLERMLRHIEPRFCIWLCLMNIDRFRVSLHCVNFLKELCLFLYVRLKTGRIMVWWYLSGSPSVRLSVFWVFFFSYILWHIELKFSILLCFTVLQIKYECRQFASIFVGVVPLFELRILEKKNPTVFRTFLLHALPYWAEILLITLFYCITDQVWVSSICINFCRSYVPFGT